MTRAIEDGFRFGRFALDLRTRELLKDGVRLRLQDQPFEVLRALLQNAGELVTREELRRELWPNGTFVDFEHSLNAAVKRLRAAIGDSADRPKCIETLARRGYRFIGHVETVGAQALRAPACRSKLTRLAVLPFVVVGEESRTAFSDGLSEEMTTALGRLFGTRVGILASGSAARAARTHAHAIREIARTLAADYLLEGAVRQDGERVRVTARLIDACTETQLWAGAYERNLADWFAVQCDVAADIARSLAVELLPAQSGPHAAGTRNTAAHQAYLKGLYHWHVPGCSGLPQAIEHYKAAIALDPGFSDAHSSLARAWVSIAEYYLAPPLTALEHARQAAERALALDESNAEAHIALGDVKRALDWNWSGAEQEYRRGIAANPSHEASYRLIGLLLTAGGRRDEARDLLQRAWELDPLCLVVNTGRAWAHYLHGDYSAALERCMHVADMNADFLPGHSVRSAALVELGRVGEAVDVLDSVPEAQHDAVSTAWLAYALARAGDSRRARALVTGLRVARAGTSYVSAYHLAIALTGLEEHDAALEAIGHACEERDPAVMYASTDPRLAPIRSRLERILREQRRLG